MIVRDYQRLLHKYVDNKKIKILQGIRRSGKSTLLYKLETDLLYSGKDAKNFLFLDFESFNLNFSNTEESVRFFLNSFIKKNNEVKYIFLNEPQCIDNFENVLKDIYQNNKDFIDIFVSTSSKKLLSKDFIEEFYYSIDFIDIYPLTFKEVYSISKEKDEEKVFNTYLTYGGFPFVYSFEQMLNRTNNHSYMQDILNAIIFKDIVQKNALRDSLTYTKIFSQLVLNPSREFSSKDIIKYLKENENKTLSNETLYNYLEYTKDSFLIQSVPKINLLKNKTLQYQEKLFLTDLGIRFPLYLNQEKDKTKILENLVFLYLKNKGYKVFTGRYLDDEVHLIAEKDKEKYYFQVVDKLNDENIKELSSIFEKIKDNFPKYFISLDKEYILENGIKHLNVIDFLLEKTEIK